LGCLGKSRHVQGRYGSGGMNWEEKEIIYESVGQGQTSACVSWICAAC